MIYIFIRANPIPVMGQHFTLGAGPAQIMGQHVLPRLYGCRRLCLEELFSACCQWLSCNAFILGHFWCHCCIPWPWKCGFWCHIIWHTFDSMDHLIMRYCVDVGHLGKWRRVRITHTADDVITQFRDHHTSMIDFRHADKCLYSAANYSKTRAFFWPLL